VANRPVLEYVVDQLVDVGVTELICITGHLSDQIEEYLDREYPDLQKRYVEQVEQRGTADAIRLARSSTPTCPSSSRGLRTRGSSGRRRSRTTSASA
jgi:NDP-sugar pyrophosphorylase family protein